MVNTLIKKEKLAVRKKTEINKTKKSAPFKARVGVKDSSGSADDMNLPQILRNIYNSMLPI